MRCYMLAMPKGYGANPAKCKSIYIRINKVSLAEIRLAALHCFAPVLSEKGTN